ncbi:MAG TPA: bifunctional diaminohydroxyphosphoribosylaminopyrimidine deaminase/5-amino-6-(5-phosphoribosylamino)uracil reductase RibD [candidate division Zixibacteria bacterium]
MKDEKFIRSALELAEKGRKATSPNPMVGAVVVKGDKILATGYHKKFGTPHAEVVALKTCGNKAKGATLYVNLEPCCHYGKTPPCTDLIIQSKIKRVVCSAIDPNPLVNCKGVGKLRKAGIKVEIGILEDEAKTLNEAYFKYITTNMPFVILRIKGTLNGMESSISTPASAIDTDAILWDLSIVNSPHLNPLPRGERKFGFTNNQIILTGTWNEISYCLKRLKAMVQRNIILAPVDDRKEVFESNREFKIWKIEKKKNGELALLPFLKRCGKEGIASLLIEGGSGILSSFLKQKLADKILFEITSDISGREELFGDLGINKMSEAIVLKNYEWKKTERSLLVSGYPAF